MAGETAAWRVNLSDIDFDAEEFAAVEDVLRSKWLTTGSRTAAFEADFTDAVDARHAAAMSNCTAALHLALVAVRVGPGDDVFVPSLTFVATANAVLYCGATSGTSARGAVAWPASGIDRRRHLLQLLSEQEPRKPVKVAWSALTTTALRRSSARTVHMA